MYLGACGIISAVERGTNLPQSATDGVHRGVVVQVTTDQASDESCAHLREKGTSAHCGPSREERKYKRQARCKGGNCGRWRREGGGGGWGRAIFFFYFLIVRE